jgi:hypothetical protein
LLDDCDLLRHGRIVGVSHQDEDSVERENDDLASRQGLRRLRTRCRLGYVRDLGSSPRHRKNDKAAADPAQGQPPAPGRFTAGSAG